jgi:hypothetical protein
VPLHKQLADDFSTKDQISQGAFAPILAPIMLKVTLIPSILAYLGEGQTTILKLRSYYKETAPLLQLSTNTKYSIL